jgi:cell division protease FtsH
MERRAFSHSLFPVVIIGLLAWMAVQTFGGGENARGETLRFSDALALVRESPARVQNVVFRPRTHEVELRLGHETRKTVYPVDQSAFELQQLLAENNIPFEAKRLGTSPWWSLLTSLLPFVLLLGFWIFLVQRTTPTERESPETPFGR